MRRLNIENIRKPVAALYPDDVELRCVEVMIPDHDGYLWILAAFVAILGNDWAWLGTKPDRQTRAQLWQTAYAATLWDLCMKCEELQECLQPFFDAIQARFDALDIAVEQINQTTQEIRETQQGNSAKETELPEVSPGDAVYAGALALVQAMDRENRKLYEEAELSFVDNAAEWTGQILDLFPAFSAQGVGAGADMANAYFENQVDNYEADYADFEAPAACSLYCYITANDNVLTYDVWGDWLDELDTLIPANACAAVYAKYSPLRQTFLNQIAELFNQEASLQSYFDRLWNAYYAGTLYPITVPPECDCPECGIEYTIDIGTENMDLDVVAAATALVERLDTSGDAYGRRVQITFDSPVRSIQFGWNTEGAADDMYAKLDDNDTVTLDAPAGSMTLEAETPGTVFIIDLGYSGDSGAYADNPARIHIIDACE